VLRTYTLATLELIGT